MKKFRVILTVTLALVACSNSEETTTNPPPTNPPPTNPPPILANSCEKAAIIVEEAVRTFCENQTAASCGPCECLSQDEVPVPLADETGFECVPRAAIAECESELLEAAEWCLDNPESCSEEVAGLAMWVCETNLCKKAAMVLEEAVRTFCDTQTAASCGPCECLSQDEVPVPLAEGTGFVCVSPLAIEACESELSAAAELCLDDPESCSEEVAGLAMWVCANSCEKAAMVLERTARIFCENPTAASCRPCECLESGRVLAPPTQAGGAFECMDSPPAIECNGQLLTRAEECLNTLNTCVQNISQSLGASC